MDQSYGNKSQGEKQWIPIVSFHRLDHHCFFKYWLDCPCTSDLHANLVLIPVFPNTMAL